MEIIKVENVSKLYDLGEVSTGTLSKDLNRWWANICGKEDPYARIGQANDRTRKSTTDEPVWALKDINFSVKQGEVVGIIGRNGAGKSTLLKIISRITTPSRGEVKVRGRIASLLEVGTGFHPEMTGRENIFMNGTLLGMTRKEIHNKLDEIIDFAGVALYIDTPVKRYSSGMQVRLGFAVAAFLEPEILIVDEVLAVGDAEFQKKAIGRMQEVSKGHGRTILFVSHNIGAIETLCEKGLVLENGMVSFFGSVGESIDKYSSNSSFETTSIMDGITICHNDIIVESLKINGSDRNLIFINSNNSSLKISIEGQLLRPKVMSIGAILYDYKKNKLGVFSPGHVLSKNIKLSEGPFTIEEIINLPNNITKGEFWLEIMLHQPNVELYIHIPNNIKIVSSGIIGITGREFEYRDCGFLMLD